MNIYDNYGNQQDFSGWYDRYYGNNDYGYRPQQNYLAELVRPQQFSYTNESFKPQRSYQQSFQQSYQPQYQTPQSQSYQGGSYSPGNVSGTYYTEHNGRLIPMSDYVQMENARVRGVSNY